MHQPERFQIDIAEPLRSYVCNRPSTTIASYRNPYPAVTTYHYENGTLQAETGAIRRELSELRNDVREIRRQQGYPTHYVATEAYPNRACPLCPSSSSDNRQYQYLQIPEYPYYQNSNSAHQRPQTTQQRTTLNKLKKKSSSSGAVHHPRAWVPGGHKNSYPNRRWNLSVRHPEP
ncbi:unnamed protein product [Adineta steineri]|uniref:Uncharacterized protein n=1 Tax=Adineta steineri TaxID=433720 RepID=A0A814SW83_9BILA|nr:unnamed protein product [Adineta steineri]CAF1341041.1 unnamed protein product [Adineta steineri]CAF1356763.1 unnamed protein product [Adineta steineri]